MLKFTPKREEDLSDLLSIGNGKFEVVNAKEIDASNGNPMIRLYLKVWDQNGKQGFIYDNLMLNENNFSLRKILHFCKATGLLDQYEKGILMASNCTGKSGLLRIGIQKDRNGQYRDKNVASDYLEYKKSANTPEYVKNNTQEKFDDDLPF